MDLPNQIPANLQAPARPLVGLDVGLLAWDQSAPLAVLDALDGTPVAIMAGEVLREIGDDHVPLGDWYCHAVGKETATEYAVRSRRVAAEYIRKYADDALGRLRIILHFTGQDAAA
jgi:hypothetical protein